MHDKIRHPLTFVKFCVLWWLTKILDQSIFIYTYILFLQNFYKNEINRKEMYLRYIYKLHALHVPADNFTEAGFTLKLYADSLRWTNQPVVADPLAQPDQPEWHRKEQLYHQILQYFDKGKVSLQSFNVYCLFIYV